MLDLIGMLIVLCVRSLLQAALSEPTEVVSCTTLVVNAVRELCQRVAGNQQVCFVRSCFELPLTDISHRNLYLTIRNSSAIGCLRLL